MKIKTLTLAIAAATASTSAIAQTIELDTIVVSANKTEQSLQDITSNVTVITAEEIEAKHYSSIAEALIEISGISFSRTGGLGSTTSIYLRGSNTQRVLVLMDGIRLNDPSTTNGANFADINLANVERIEIIKGAQSGVWGADAAAGVINIITKSNTSEINVEYGAYNTRKATIATSKQLGNTQLSLNANRTLTEGFSTLAPNGEDIDQYEDDGYQNTNIILKSQTQLSDKQTLKLLFNHTNAFANYDGYTNYQPDPNSIKRSKTRTDLAGIEYTIQDTKISFQQSDFKSTQLDEGYTDEVSGQTQSLEIQHSVGDFLVGAQHSRNTTDSEKPSFFYDLNNGWAKTYQEQNIQHAANHSNAVFVTHQSKFKHLITNEALRWDDYSNFDSKVTGKLGVKFPINEDAALSFNYGTAYNAPSQIQILNPWGTSNPELRPENSKEWSATFQYKGLSLTHFDKRVEDLIKWDNNQYQNLDGITEIQGTEFEYKISLGDFDIATNYTHLDTELLRRPEDQIGLNIDWFATEKLDINLNGQYIGKRVDSSFNPVHTGYYDVWNTVANYEFNKQFSGYIKVDNLFDKYYQVVDGYATAERSFYAGVKAKF